MSRALSSGSDHRIAGIRTHRLFAWDELVGTSEIVEQLVRIYLDLEGAKSKHPASGFTI